MVGPRFSSSPQYKEFSDFAKPRAAIAVTECGVNGKIHLLKLGQGDQKAADYVKLNPTARIPTLISGMPLSVRSSVRLICGVNRSISASLRGYWR